MIKNGTWEGRAVWASNSKGWIAVNQADGGIEISVRGFVHNMTPEEAKTLSRQLAVLANDAIKRKAVLA